MNRRIFGTVLVVLRHSGFVVLGSDTGKLEDMKTDAGHGSKIVCHAALPLMAVGGMAEFTISGKTTVVTQLLEAQMLIWSGRVNLGDVMSWAKATLLPLVQEANAAYPVEQAGHIYLIVGLCNGGKGETGVIKVKEGVEFEMEDWSGVIAPATLSVWKAELDRRKNDPYGIRIANSYQLAARAKRLIEEAIATDKKLARKRKPHCGCHAEVVVVDEHGARFEHRAPSSP